MDSHFDFDHFHPSFLGDDGWSTFGVFGDFFHVHMDDFLARAQECNLPQEIVHNALESACDFVGIPSMTFEDAPIMAVDTGNPTSFLDDKLLFSREQMINQGINDEQSLSLICTHEVAHRVLQYLHDTNQLSQWQTELACDVFMGVRSIVEDIDIEPVRNSLRDTYDSATHPGFELRNEYIEVGRTIGKDFAAQDIPVTYENVLLSLKDYLGRDAERILQMEQHYKNLESYDMNQIQSLNAFTKEDVDFYAHQARITSGSEQARWLERYNWAVNHLSGYTTVPESFTNNPDKWIGHHSINAYTKEDVDFYAHQVRISSGSEQGRWLERYNWALKHLDSYTRVSEGLINHPEEWEKHSHHIPTPGEEGMPRLDNEPNYDELLRKTRNPSNGNVYY